MHESRSIPLCSSSVPAAFIILISIVCGAVRGLTRIMTRYPVTWSVLNVCTSANIFASRSAQTGTQHSGRQTGALSVLSEVRSLSHFPSVCTALARHCCRLTAHSSASLCSAAAAAVCRSTVQIDYQCAFSMICADVHCLIFAAVCVLDLQLHINLLC
jgi:hypothetical protein